MSPLMSSYSNDDGAERESDQKKTFVAERENYQMLSFIFTLISTVNENESGREVGHQRWQIESLVTNVQTELQNVTDMTDISV